MAVASPSAVLASPNGFAIAVGSAPSIEGVNVPEIVIMVDAGQHNISRATIQDSISRSLRSNGVNPDLIQLQSVATAAIQFAADQDMGSQTFTFEDWCARVSVGGQ